MNTALEVAEYIIDKCTREKQPISNLQLQKILYYIQREFLQIGSQAFEDAIEAWQFGPVVPTVYKRYCGFAGKPISIRYHVDLVQDFEKIMNPIIEKKRRLNPWEMVDDTHAPEKAWALVYKNGLGNHQVIPIELIRDKG